MERKRQVAGKKVAVESNKTYPFNKLLLHSQFFLIFKIKDHDFKRQSYKNTV